MTVIAQESSRRVRRPPMRAPVRSDVGFSASMASARAAALALCMALAAAAVTIASLPRSAGKAATAEGLPIAVTIDRRLKGDRLDPQHSSMPDAPVSPGNIVPKTDPATTGPATTSPATGPATPADPAYAPQEDLIERGCAPIPSTMREPSDRSGLETLQCVASAAGATSPRHALAQRGPVLALDQAQMRKQPAGEPAASRGVSRQCCRLAGDFWPRRLARWLPSPGT
jgi:hypothetical protein